MGDRPVRNISCSLHAAIICSSRRHGLLIFSLSASAFHPQTAQIFFLEKDPKRAQKSRKEFPCGLKFRRVLCAGMEIGKPVTFPCCHGKAKTCLRLRHCQCPDQSCLRPGRTIRCCAFRNRRKSDPVHSGPIECREKRIFYFFPGLAKAGLFRPVGVGRHFQH